MKTGFVILNYNTWKLSQELAMKVASFECIDDVIIVDNVSTDNSYERLNKIRWNKIHVIQSKKNGGYSYGNNYGAQVCLKLGTEIMFISNPDVDIEEKDIQKIIRQFNETDYSVLTGVEYDIDGNMNQPPLWKIKTYMDDLIDCFLIGRKLTKSKLGLQLDRSIIIQDVEMIKGSFFGVKLADFSYVGGFDEGVFLFCEERIISRKIKNARMKMGIVTNVTYRHNHSTSINKAYKNVNTQIKILYDSRMYYQKKYNSIGMAKFLLLKCAMIISLLEYMVKDGVKYLSFRLRKVEE